MAYTATGGILSTASAAKAVALDPYLPQVVDLVLKLEAIEKGESSSSSSSSSPISSSNGVGLRNVVGPLKTFVAIQEKPWILPVAVVGIVGTIFAAGYFTRKIQKG